jgi:hypothetical protein
MKNHERVKKGSIIKFDGFFGPIQFMIILRVDQESSDFILITENHPIEMVWDSNPPYLWHIGHSLLEDKCSPI